MADAIHGKSAKVMDGANVIAHINKWSLKVKRDAKQQTAMGDVDLPWHKFVAGLAGAECEFEGQFDPTDTNGHVAILASMTSDTPRTIHLLVNAAKKFTVSAFVTGADIDAPLDDIETAKYSLQITGAGANALVNV